MEKQKQTDAEQRKVLDGFMSWMTCDRDYSENTVRSFMYAAADFFQHFDEFNAVNCRKYVSMLMRSGRRASTVNSRISGLSALSRYLKVPVHIKHIKTPRKLYLDNDMSELEYNRLVNFLAGYDRRVLYGGRLYWSEKAIRSDFCSFRPACSVMRVYLSSPVI